MLSFSLLIIILLVTKAMPSEREQESAQLPLFSFSYAEFDLRHLFSTGTVLISLPSSASSSDFLTPFAFLLLYVETASLVGG